VTTLAPRTADEVTEAIRWGLSVGESFEVVGAASKRSLGRPVNATSVLDVSAVSGIVSYEPAELVLTARAGTPMPLIFAALAEHAQCLAFEPPDLTLLLGASGAADDAADNSVLARTRNAVGAGSSVAPLRGTLGGVIATGLSGPRRFKAGAARDHVLGIAAVSGRGEAFVGGGKVVKNVTGYDIPKLMAGSYGTLAVLTEITMKVLPAPETSATLVVTGLDVLTAVRAMTDVLQSPLDVTGACHLPAGVAALGQLPADSSVTALRVEGFALSVQSRSQALRERLGALGAVDRLDRPQCSAFWRAVRDVSPFAGANSDWIWRVSIPPATAATLVERIERAFPGSRLFLDWAGGLVWLATPSPERLPSAAAAAPLRELLADTGGGHATLIRAPASVRANIAVFQPQPAALAALAKRVKSQFDPSHLLNPGRMYAGV
jgi:glycolate oxidase FAD binding subunit